MYFVVEMLIALLVLPYLVGRARVCLFVVRCGTVVYEAVWEGECINTDM